MKAKKVYKKIDDLEALFVDRMDSVEKVLKRLLGRAEVTEVLQGIIKELREERKELLNRLMAKNFESFQTYTGGGEQESVGEETPPEENADMAGEIFQVEN